MLNHSARPQLRFALAMLLAIAIPVVVFADIAVPIAKLITPENFRLAPNILLSLFGVTVVLSGVLLIIFLAFYLFERRKHWVITPMGIELWRATRLSQRLMWSDIISVRLARFTMRLKSLGKPRVEYLMFIDRMAIAPHIPHEKLQIVSRL